MKLDGSRWLVLVLISLLLGLPIQAAYAQEGNRDSRPEADGHHLVWSRSLSESLEEARKTNKYVLADIYTNWCGWCKQLDRTTFEDAGFVEYVNEHFVPVKLNAEDKGEGTDTAEKNDVGGFPTALVFNPKGKVVGKIVGYLDANKYQARLRKIAKTKKSH